MAIGSRRFVFLYVRGERLFSSPPVGRPSPVVQRSSAPAAPGGGGALRVFRLTSVAA